MLPLTLEHPPQHMTPTPPPTSPWRNKNQPGGSSQHWQWWSEEEAMSAEGEEEKPGFGAPICRLHNDFILFWKSVILWRVGCNQRFLSLLFEHARCWIADCCLFALRLGYEIKSLCLLFGALCVCPRGCLFVLGPKYKFYVWKFCVQVCVLWGFFLWSFGKGFSGATVSMQVPEGVALPFCGGNKKNGPICRKKEKMN